jgi:hypothetical protein
MPEVSDAQLTVLLMKGLQELTAARFRPVGHSSLHKLFWTSYQQTGPGAQIVAHAAFAHWLEAEETPGMRCTRVLAGPAPHLPNFYAAGPRYLARYIRCEISVGSRRYRRAFADPPSASRSGIPPDHVIEAVPADALQITGCERWPRALLCRVAVR